MKRFKNILLVADGKTEVQTVLRRAVTLAKDNRAGLTVIEVIKDLPHDIRTLITPKHIADIRETIINEQQEQLEYLVDPYKTKGIQIITRVLVGTPFLEIIREVLRNRHDLVMVPTEGKGRPKEMLFGTTIMNLMRKCPCPVWAVKPTGSERFKRILAAVDPDPSDDIKSGLSAKIMELAYSLAKMERGKLHVVHIWAQYDESILWSRRLSVLDIDKMYGELMTMHRSWLDELLREYAPGTKEDRVYLLQGETATVISELAGKYSIDLIVMGTVARTGVAGVFIGNTAEKVLQQVDCSVLAVKPDRFITPVRLKEK